MIKRILLACLDSYSNLGDSIIRDTSTYLLKKAAAELGNCDMHLEILDIMLCSDALQKQNCMSSIRKNMSGVLTIFGEKLPDNLGLTYRIYTLKNFIKYRKYFSKKIKKADVVVFAGGAYLKFKKEEFQYSIRHIIDLSQKYHVPVMLNATGIEGCDNTDIRCRALRKRINLPCIKMITTRDSVDFLNQNFIVRSDIVTAEVGDVALWAPECYGIHADKKYDVGVNIANPELFKNNGIKSQKTLTDVLKELIVELKKRNLSVALFGNGKSEDYECGLRILQDPIFEGVKLLPNAENPQQYIAQVNQFRCVIPTRFHALVVAYAFHVPCFGFLWNEKERVFLERTEQLENFESLSNINPSEIGDEISESIKLAGDSMPDIQELKNDTYRYLKAFLLTVL